MNTDIQIRETIDKYLQGSMTEEERVAFESRMTEDPKLADKVEEIRYTNEAIHYASLSALREDIGKDIQNIKYRPHSGIFKTLVLSASVLAIAAIGYYAFDQETQEDVKHSQTIISDTSLGNKHKQTQSGNKTGKGQIVEVPAMQDSMVDKENKTESKTSLSDSYSTDADEKKSVPEFNQPEDTQPAQLKDTLSLQEVSNSLPQDTTEPHKKVIDSVKTDTAGGQKSTKEQPATEESSCEATFDIKTTSSCKEEPTGSIDVSIPDDGEYGLKIDEGQTSHNDGKFNNIAAGKHTVVVNYGEGCEFREQVLIDEKWCPENKSYSFNPDYGEKWEIPYEEGARGKVIIYNTMKKVVYKTNFGAGGEHWNGTGLNGSTVPVGNYIAMIKYADGRVQKVDLTIVR